MNFFYPEELPVVALKDSICEAISDHQVVVVAGDTGSGKTTQLPKFCLELFGDDPGLIGCTQPRRIAATSVSSRVAEELGDTALTVGYKIRFYDRTSDTTKVKFMTDGVLLAETRTDPLLKKYKVIILDEAHERSLNIDFLLGYIKRILPKRPDLKVIITSATIDTEAFSAHFGNAPVVQVSGRTYPVEVQYKPPGDDEAGENYVEHCARAIIDVYHNRKPGDILAFLPTEKDIRACCEFLEGQVGQAAILPLYGRLPAGEQKRIFQQKSETKIVVATNVAETSLTVPGIRYVVDSGLARMSYYNTRAKTTSLPVRKISRASCDQRKGRCGRVGPGVCIRLYDEEDYTGRDEYTLPEIKRSNLAEVILKMISLNLGKPEEFPFIDPPFHGAIRDGYRLLFELRAITADNQLTANGQLMSRLPIDPCIARVLIEANRENCLTEIVVIAAALAIQDPKVRPTESENKADIAHQIYHHPHSDFMVYLNMWNHFHSEAGSSRSWSKLKKYCKKQFLSFQRMREWFDLHDQLIRLTKELKDFSFNEKESSYQQIHKALCSGYLRNIATHKKGKLYQNSSNQELMIFPGSPQFKSSPKWMVCSSFLETNRLYGLTVADIDQDWLESLGSHLVKYSWSTPRYSKKSGQIIADEKVSLFGLILISSRIVNFPKRAKKNWTEARDIFIQDALIAGELQGNYRFLDNNLSLIEKWRDEEDKIRNTSIVVDDSAFYQFYADRLPADVYDRATLNRFLKRKGHPTLMMRDEDIVNTTPDQSQLAGFPDTVHTGSQEIRLEYSFSPGKENDGVTFLIPAMAVQHQSEHFFQWLVPGLLHEKITYLLKGLPKKLRKHLVPVNVAADRIHDELTMYNGSLLNSMESAVHKLYRIQVNRSDWPSDFPVHLTPRYQLIDDKGEPLCSGREIKTLIDKFSHLGGGSKVNSEDLSVKNPLIDRYKDKHFSTYDFEDLPDALPLYSNNNKTIGFIYPYLEPVVDKGAVKIEFHQDRNEAARLNISGLEFFYRLHFSSEYKSVKQYISSLLTAPSFKSLISQGLTKKQLKDDLISYIIRSLFISINGTIPDKHSFTHEIKQIKSEGFYRKGQQIADTGAQLIRQKADVQKHLAHFVALDKRRSSFTTDKVKQFQRLLGEILPPDYFHNHSDSDADSTSRQLQCFKLRLERFYANPLKDTEKAKLLQPYLTNYTRLIERKDELSDEIAPLVAEYKRLIDEYRISLFSPEIKTRFPISPNRLQKHKKLIDSKC